MTTRKSKSNDKSEGKGKAKTKFGLGMKLNVGTELDVGTLGRIVGGGVLSRLRVGLVVVGLVAGGAVALAPVSAAGQAPVQEPAPAQASGPAQGQAPAAAAKPGVDGSLTAEQKKDLLASEDEIFHFVSTDTGLAITRPVKTVFVTRVSVNAELRKKFDEDKGNKRMERSELVLKKFGFLDQDFKLRPFLLGLLTEQIAGFYDNKKKTMNLLDWVAIEDQKPVMAHELTHALQDQRVPLAKWEDPQPVGVAKNVMEDNAHLVTDEAGTAREAVLEGQAMVSFADYLLRGTGQTLKDRPDLAQRLENGAGDSGDSPVLARAPLVLQQALLFPYTTGLGFEAEIVTKAGVPRAFAGVLDAPPSTSSEILHPDAYLAGTGMPVMRLPDIHPVLMAAGYEPYDTGVMGELDVRMATELFGGRPLAEALAPAWNGGIYYAAQRKSATEAEKATTKSIALLYSSHWKNADSAKSFFHVFEGEMARQYDGLKRRRDDETDGELVYSTREGDVVLRVKDSTVWVSEGFELDVARKLREMVEAANPVGVGPVMNAEGRGRGSRAEGHELMGGLGEWMGSFGMMRVVLGR